MTRVSSRLLVLLIIAAMLIMGCGNATKEQPQATEEDKSAPESVQVVDTRIGKLEFTGGYPTEATIGKAFDQLDMQRATQAYLDFMPMASVQSIFESHIRDNGMTAGDVGVYVEQGAGKADAIGLTYNTESIYASGFVDLKEQGAVVVEVPPNVLGVVNDGWQRWLVDLGLAGPDKGNGGKYLLLPPGYNGDMPEGYFVVKCPTYRNWVMVRGFVQDTGTGDMALDYYRKKFRMYSLATGSGEGANYVSLSFVKADTTHPRDVTYFDLLDKIVQYEPASAFTPYQLGLLKTLGIEKGKPFAPDERMKKLLAEGVAIGDAIAKANAFENRLDGVHIYSDRKYEYIFVGGKYDFTADNVLLLDARSLFHYTAIVVTPAMAAKMVGVGSQYLATYRDEDNQFLMGQNTYKLHLPKGIPAKNFWSVTVYDPDTRSLLQNEMTKPSVSTYDKPDVNEDGSVDIWFAPEAPTGKEKNWIRTIPGEGWFIYIRLYGPLEPFFDQSWKPDDIVKME